MNEKLLQYLWNFKIFTSFDFKDTAGRPLQILNFGRWNQDAGPDFLDARIKIDNTAFAGHIELHLKSSDWIFHRHNADSAYQNIILHAVLSDDTAIPELAEKGIPTLELAAYIDTNILRKYGLLMRESQFIPCEEIFEAEKIPVGFTEQALLKKLDEKASAIAEKLSLNKNNFEAVLFQSLAYAFGLKVNAPVFEQIAESIDFGIVQKVRQNRMQLEALLLGRAAWLNKACDAQTAVWKREYDFLKIKYALHDLEFQPKFLRLRPPGFPTLRLSQLAHLYHREQNLFSKIISAKNTAELYDIFNGISASEYWDGRYNFGKESGGIQPKTLSRDFTDILIINAILPLKYAFHKNQDEYAADRILDFYGAIPAEKNKVADGWRRLGVKIKSTAESQAFVHHFKTMCEAKNCLNCSIGFKLLKT